MNSISTASLCPTCHWYKQSGDAFACGFCAALPIIRAALPKDFERHIHMMPPRTHASGGVRMDPEPFIRWGAVCVQGALFKTTLPVNYWEYYFYNYIWQAAQITGTLRSRCSECASGFRVIEQSLLAQVARQEEARQRATEEAKKREAENSEVCRICLSIYLKLPLGTAHQGSAQAFNLLRMCGTCIYIYRTSPLFESTLQVIFDDAREKGRLK